MTDKDSRHIPVVARDETEPFSHSKGIILGLLMLPLAVLAIGTVWFLFSLKPAPPPAPAISPAAVDQAPKPTVENVADTTVDTEPLDLNSVAPPTPWKTLGSETLLTRIGVGSCLSQRHPQPIWDGVLGLKNKPQLFLMVGDNVYGDVKSADMSELKRAYQAQARHPEFSRARRAFPFMATWDDHDYGANDAGRTFEHRAASARLFAEYWQLTPPRPPQDGIHHARIVGPPGRRVQVIMLDTRSFRSKLTRKDKNGSFPHWGRYQPSTDDEQQMLGNAQWAWLAAQLAQPAEIRLIVSSVQVLAESHGFERWGNLPKERARLMSLLEVADAKGVVLLSGDRHAGAFYGRKLPNGRFLPEMTSSSLNRSYGPSKDGASPVRIGDVRHQENFGLIDIDWDRRQIELSLRGMDGTSLETLPLTFEEIGL